MPTAVFDSSVLVRRYLVDEPAAAQALAVLESPDRRRVVSQLAHVEVSAAIASAARNSRISTERRGELLLSWERDLQRKFAQAALVPAIWEAAVTLVRDHPVRSLDALHIATALVLSTLMDGDDTLVFVTADGRQAEAAEAVGLAVEFIGEPSAATDPQS